ncbi:xanthine dehydrogenase family protein [Desulfurococcaceae archaeon MEX13E-LK6-19]|nr:xanthine dehydrogenase family protein [Desulfurococcaceae archaeon MEX13E-LK6-19]
MAKAPEYVRIVEEIFEKFKGKPLYYVGKHSIRWDAITKITGKAMFTADFIKLYKNLVWVYSVRTKYAHAWIKSIDVSEAAKYPGVLRVITAKDIPGVNDVGYVIPDQPLIAEKKVRYIGDTVALIVAEDPYIAREAGELVRVEYEPLPVYTDVEQIIDIMTLKEKPHERIHEERDSDIVAHFKIRAGDVDKAFKKADVIVENKYKTPMQEHAYLEPEAALAIPEPDGGITIIASTQCPFDVRRAVAKVLNMPQNKVRVIVPAVGGGFGGKEDVVNEIGAKAALAAYLTGRPAIVVHTREESMIGHSKRHPAVMWYKHAAKKDGTLLAVEAHIVFDTGGYASLGPFVAWRATVHATGPYKVKNARIDTLAVYTNTVYSGAFRGFGNPQIHFAVERQMDILAEELKMDPVELRLKNLLRAGDKTVHGQLLTSEHGVGLEEALKKAVEAADWYNKRKLYSNQTGTIRKGIGVALMWHGNSIGVEGADYSSATLIINRDGSITFRTGLMDMGQGSLWGLVLIAAEILGVPPSYFKIEQPDTASTPDAGPTVASRATVMGGNATLVAAYKLRKRLNEVAARMLGCKPDDIVIRAPEVYCRNDPNKKTTWQAVVEQSFWDGVPLQEFGYYRAPPARWEEETGQGEPYITYTFGAIISEVTVDMETGAIKVDRIITAYDIGKVINPVGAELHAEGGAIQGMGYAIMEEIIHDKDGVVRNPNLSTYYIPTIKDAPEIIPIFVESGYKRGPFGAKGLGEPSINGIAPSIANAISHALGIHFFELPITPHKIYLELKKRGLIKF